PDVQGRAQGLVPPTLRPPCGREDPSKASARVVRVWFLASARMTALRATSLPQRRRACTTATRQRTQRPHSIAARPAARIDASPPTFKAALKVWCRQLSVPLADARIHLKQAHELCAFGSSLPQE